MTHQGDLASVAEEALRVYREARREGIPAEWAMEDAIRAVDLLREAVASRNA